MTDDMADPHGDAMMEEKEDEAAMSDDAMMEEKEDEAAMSDDAMMEETEDETMMEEDMADDAMMPKPAWQTIALTDVRTGQTFTLADFAGKTVFVETMATWCSNCRRLLGNVATARSQMAGEDVVFIALPQEGRRFGRRLHPRRANWRAGRRHGGLSRSARPEPRGRRGPRP